MDLLTAAVHARAAYGYAMAAGHLSSISKFAMLHTVRACSQAPPCWATPHSTWFVQRWALLHDDPPRSIEENAGDFGAYGWFRVMYGSAYCLWLLGTCHPFPSSPCCTR